MNPISPTLTPALHAVRTAALAMAFLIGGAATAQDDFASNWPNFRGPTFNGTSTAATPPTSWSEDENVKWKVRLPGSGNNSSPVVWGDKVFVLTAIPQPPQAGADEAEPTPPRSGGKRGRRRGRRRSVPLTPTRFVTLCYDRHTGDKIWEQLAVETTPHQGHHPDHSFASASPVTDGRHVYSHFGSRGLYCYDMDGNLKWKRDDFGQMMTRNGFGEGSSPVLHKGIIVVPWDHEGQSWVTALDALTGETLWKKDRDEPSNWVTPVVVENGDAAVVVTGGENYARGYDLKTGEELWKSSGFSSRPVSAPVVQDDVVFLASGRQGFVLQALNVDGEGNLTDKNGVVWNNDRSAPDVPSMLLSNGRLSYMRGSSNVLNCLDAKTGEPVFDPVRVDQVNGVYASLVAADGKIVIVGRDGTSVVIEDGEEFRVLSTNKLDDAIDATPALAGKQIFLRGKKYLYCIEDE